jgi:hypothetical protein
MPSQNLMVVSKKNRGERPLVPKKIRIPKTDGSSVSVNPTLLKRTEKSSNSQLALSRPRFTDWRAAR